MQKKTHSEREPDILVKYAFWDIVWKPEKRIKLGQFVSSLGFLKIGFDYCGELKLNSLAVSRKMSNIICY